YQFVIKFETRNEIRGLNLKVLKNGATINNGLFLSLTAADKFLSWYRFITTHTQLLDSQTGVIRKVGEALAKYAVETPTFKQLLQEEEYSKFKDFDEYREHAIRALKKTVDYINIFNLKGEIFRLAEIKDISKLNWNALYLNVISDLDSVAEDHIQFGDIS